LRPILRKADSHECLIDGGTRVRVWMNSPAIFDQMLSESNIQKTWTLEERCAWLCPTLDVNLYVEQKKKTLVVGASDLITIKGSKLLQRLLGSRANKKSAEVIALQKMIEPNLRLMKSISGEVVGRACVSVMSHNRKVFSDVYGHVTSGVVTIGGFRSCELSGICGVLVGRPHTAARNIGVPVADLNAFQPWASEQAELIFKDSLDSEYQSDCASTIRALYGSTQKLHIAEDKGGWKSVEEISKENHADEILILQDAALSIARMDVGEIELHKNVFSVDMGITGILQTERHDIWIDWPPEDNSENIWSGEWSFHSKSLQGALMEAIAIAWGVPLRHVLEVSQRSTDNKSIKKEIGLCNGKPVVLRVNVIRRHK